MTLSRVLRGLFIRFPFSVYKNVHLTEEDAVNICNNIFFNQAKNEKKRGGLGNKVTYKVVLYKTSTILYILISSSTSFICNSLWHWEKKDSVIVDVNYVINAKRR